MFISCGILFNHESERRGDTFVTKKISKAAARIKLGKQEKLYLGNLEARRDWGYAPDYVRAMHLMLQANEPNDYVVATGETYSVKDYLERVFEVAGLDWKDYVVIDPRYFRPTEVNVLCGDASKIKTELGWSSSTSIDELCVIMFQHDYDSEKSMTPPTSL
jgi:GDPmannose 4,6-dehydratase